MSLSTPRAARTPLNPPRAGRQQGQAGSVRVCGGSLLPRGDPEAARRRHGVSLALYRKYRPASFAEVKGQEHVTGPLRQALRNGKVHHAYLFSGPRGCGKTSSARILARSLNCEQGPTPDPCGVCDSCVALAPNGAGLARRHRDRRGLEQRRRRRARAARPGLLRAGVEQVQGLHHRRGPHGHDGGVQRAAQARRGAAGVREVRLRDHRAGEGAARPSGRAPTTTRSGSCRAAS